MLGERLSLIKIVWRVVFGGGRRVWDAEVEVRSVECVSGVAGEMGKRVRSVLGQRGSKSWV